MTGDDSHRDSDTHSAADSPDATLSDQGLTRKSAVGAAWTMGALLITEPLRLATTAILARLLTPQDFGLVGMAAVFIGLGTLANDFGFTVALIKEKNLTRRQVTGVFWANLAVGGVFTVAAILVAPLLAAFYQEPEVSSIFRALAATFAISSLFLVQNALLRRRMDFRTPAIASGVSVGVNGVVGIACALSGLGVWSLVYGNIAGVIASGVVVQAVSRLRPGISFAWTDVKPFMGFGAKLTGGEIAHYAVANVDNVVVGRALGAAPLGIYSVAYNLITYPVRKIAKLIAGVGLPAFARIQDEPVRFRGAYERALSMTAYTLVPLLAVSVVLGDHLIVGLYGGQWVDAITPFRILCVAALFAGLGYFSELALKSLGDADGYLRWAVVSLVLFAAGAIVGSRWGVNGVAAGVAVASAVAGWFGQLTVRATAGITWSSVGKAVAPPLGAGAVAAVLTLAIRVLLETFLEAPLAIAILAGLVGVLGAWLALRRIPLFSGVLELEGLVRNLRRQPG